MKPSTSGHAVLAGGVLLLAQAIAAGPTAARPLDALPFGPARPLETAELRLITAGTGGETFSSEGWRRAAFTALVQSSPGAPRMRGDRQPARDPEGARRSFPADMPAFADLRRSIQPDGSMRFSVRWQESRTSYDFGGIGHATTNVALEFGVVGLGAVSGIH